MPCAQDFGGVKWAMKGRFIDKIGNRFPNQKRRGGWDLETSGALKQGWRLMHAKDSLFYECFKAKYFPRCSFLEAVESPNCSFVWRSIMAAQEILMQGCC